MKPSSIRCGPCAKRGRERNRRKPNHDHGPMLAHSFESRATFSALHRLAHSRTISAALNANHGVIKRSRCHVFKIVGRPFPIFDGGERKKAALRVTSGRSLIFGEVLDADFALAVPTQFDLEIFVVGFVVISELRLQGDVGEKLSRRPPVERSRTWQSTRNLPDVFKKFAGTQRRADAPRRALFGSCGSRPGNRRWFHQRCRQNGVCRWVQKSRMGISASAGHARRF